MCKIEQQAKRRHIEIVVVPTEEACSLLDALKSRDTYAVLHCTY